MQVGSTKCPYKEVCECPGDESELGSYENRKGFIREEEGVLCLDWDIVIPFEEVSKLRVPEGRHLTDAVAAAGKMDEAVKRYNRSEKRQAAQKRYEDKPKAKASKRGYYQTEKFKLSVQKYYYSDKGQESHLKRRKLVSDFGKAASWLKDNPGKTYEDFLKETEQDVA